MMSISRKNGHGFTQSATLGKHNGQDALLFDHWTDPTGTGSFCFHPFLYFLTEDQVCRAEKLMTKEDWELLEKGLLPEASAGYPPGDNFKLA